MANNQIALMARSPDLDTPFESQGKAMQIQNLMNTNQIHQMDMDQRRQAIADDAATRNIYATNQDPAERIKALYKVNPKAAMAAEKEQIENDAKSATTNETKVKTKTGEYDLREKKRQKAITDIAALTSPAHALASLAEHEASGDLTPEAAAAVRATIPQNPAEFPKWQVGMLQKIMSAKDAAGQIAPDANTVANNQTSVKTTGMTNATSRANNRDTQAGENTRSAASLENQLKINGMGKNGSPSGDVEAMAQAIASGKLAPINGFALAKPRGQAIMARAMEINPNYDAGDYAAKNNALKAFSTGKEGAALRSFNVATDHLETLDKMVDALDNGKMQTFNQLGNYIAEKTGSPAPTNFDAVKTIVSKEVVKAIVAGGGGVGEREELETLLGKAKSNAQLKGVITHFKDLMDAQRGGLMDQYHRTTGRTDGSTAFAPSSKAHVVPDGAIQMLKSNPALRQQFEEKYGAGSADSILGK